MDLDTVKLFDEFWLPFSFRFWKGSNPLKPVGQVRGRVEPVGPALRGGGQPGKDDL
jgi:hypothetical protein